MKKKTKTTFKTYAAWDFEKEADEFNRMSEKGWQLTVCGCFHQKYEFDNSVIYRYQMDFNNRISDVGRYDDTFRELGWERVNSTFNGWHIFRKKFDPSLPEIEYEIYTDVQSRNDMLTRWRNVALIMTIIIVATSISSLSVSLSSCGIIRSIPLIMMYFIIAVMLISALVGINNLISGKKNKHRFNLSLCLSLLIFWIAIFFISSFIYLDNIFYTIGVTIGILCGLLIFVVSIAVKSIINR